MLILAPSNSWLTYGPVNFIIEFRVYTADLLNVVALLKLAVSFFLFLNKFKFFVSTFKVFYLLQQSCPYIVINVIVVVIIVIYCENLSQLFKRLDIDIWTGHLTLDVQRFVLNPCHSHQSRKVLFVGLLPMSNFFHPPPPRPSSPPLLPSSPTLASKFNLLIEHCFT